MRPVDLNSTTSGMTSARRLARTLRRHEKNLVLTESCTGGLIASWLTKIPGISEHFCGSAVVYRNATKSAWLEVSPQVLVRPGPVSRVVAEAMVRGVLKATPEADVAASITGHFGPDAPPSQDGLFFVGLAHRGSSRSNDKVSVSVQRLRFSPGPQGMNPRRVRLLRQRQAGRVVCELLVDWVEQSGRS